MYCYKLMADIAINSKADIEGARQWLIRGLDKEKETGTISEKQYKSRLARLPTPIASWNRFQKSDDDEAADN